MRGPVISVAVSDAARLLGGVPWPAWAPPDGPRAPLAVFLGYEVVALAGDAQLAAWRAQLAELAAGGWRIRERQDGRRCRQRLQHSSPRENRPHARSDAAIGV